jgi:hypothetical protein
MPGYSYLTLGAARAELAARLEDPANVYWTAAELNDLIAQSLRTWQALTSTFKQRATFAIAPGGGQDGSAFYSLTGLLSGAILTPVSTDQAVVATVLAGLLEPPLTPSWTGTGQYLFSQISNALQNRVNRWLGDTGSGVTRNIQSVSVGAARVFLPESVLDVRRAAWVNGLGLYSTLWRDDELAMQAFLNPGFNAPQDPPMVWGKFVIPPVGIEVYPPPLNAGQIETLVIPSGPQVGPDPATVFSAPVVLGIPENFVWGIAFGVLSDLYSADGPARDPERAVYAESRYQESVELYRLNPSLIQTQINGIPVWSGSVFEMDSFLASWQSAPGVPQFAGLVGHNLMAFGPVPDDTYTVTVDVVANIPLPVWDTDFIQVDRGALNPLLDYTEHVAAFKMAGQEFKGTEKLRQNFYVQAALENNRITKSNFYRSALELPVKRQQQEVPRI